MNTSGFDRLAETALAFSKALEPFSERLREVAERLADAYPIILRDAFHLGQLGWTVPMWAAPNLPSYLVEKLDPVGIDDYFLGHCKGPRSKASARLFDVVQTAGLLELWRPALEQSVRAQRQHLHLVVVPALFIIVGRP